MSTYPYEPGYKAEGPASEAAARMRDVALSLAERAIACLEAHGPQTVDQVANRLGEDPDNIRPRFPTELRQAEREGRKPRCASEKGGTNRKGNPCLIWRAITEDPQDSLDAQIARTWDAYSRAFDAGQDKLADAHLARWNELCARRAA